MRQLPLPPPLFPYTTLFRSCGVQSARQGFLRNRRRPRSLRAIHCDLSLPQRPLEFTEVFDRRKLRSEEHTSELQSRFDLVCRLLFEKKNTSTASTHTTT